MVACTGDGRPDAMHGQWLTYGEAAVRLGVTAEAARRRAIRGKWARMPGNDGRTRVMVPDELHPPRTGPVRPDGSALVDALEGHIATLKAQLAAAEARADKAIAELVALAQRMAGPPTPEPPAGAQASPKPMARAWRWLRRTGG